MELELRDYIRILRKRRWFVVLAVALCVAAAGVLTVLSTPVYQAQSKLFVGQRQVDARDVSAAQAEGQLVGQLLKSYATIIRTRPIAERAVERESLDLSPQVLANALRADPIVDTRIIQISYQHADPATAQRVVNAIAEVFVDEIERIETPTAEGGEPAIKVSVVEPALRPSSPIRPQPARNIALAVVLGLMVGVGVAFLVEYLDTSVRAPEDAEQAAGIPVLAAVPEVESEGREMFLERDAHSVGAEAFRKLRTSIQFMGVDHPVQVIGVTSPMAQDGKTTTSLNLAAAFAQAGMRTILVEADLRRPTLHQVFPSDGQRGLTTVLIGRVPLEQAILPTPVRNLSYIPAGAIPPNPAELLASGHMVDILNKLRTMADMVIVDTPPLLPVADASALASRVDGMLVVARSGSTHRDRLREAVGLIHKVGGRPLGIVLNWLGPQDSGYGYYYYGYSYHADAPAFESHGQAASRLQEESTARQRAGDPS